MKITYLTENYDQHQKNIDNVENAKCAVQCIFNHEFESECESVENDMAVELRHRASNIAWQKEQMLIG